MVLNPSQIDDLIDQHFRFEATDNVAGVVASLVEDVVHEVIPSPVGQLHGRAKAENFYAMLFDAIKGESVSPVRRLYGENFVVDEVEWAGHVKDGRIFLCDGQSGPVRFRMLHVIEFEDDLISNEQVWCDLAAIQRQLANPDAER